MRNAIGFGRLLKPQLKRKKNKRIELSESALHQSLRKERQRRSSKMS